MPKCVLDCPSGNCPCGRNLVECPDGSYGGKSAPNCLVNCKSGRIRSGNGQSCLDIHGPDYDSCANGGKVQSWGCYNGVNQQFKFRISEGSDMGVLQTNTNECLDVHGADYESSLNGGKVQLWDCTGGISQKWRIVGSTIQSSNGQCLDLHGPDYDSAQNGGKIQMWDCNNNVNQVFSFDESYVNNDEAPMVQVPENLYQFQVSRLGLISIIGLVIFLFISTMINCFMNCKKCQFMKRSKYASVKSLDTSDEEMENKQLKS